MADLLLRQLVCAQWNTIGHLQTDLITSNYEEKTYSQEEHRWRLNSKKKSRFPKLLKVNKMAAVKLSRPENDATQAQWACISKPEAKLGKTCMM